MVSVRCCGELLKGVKPMQDCHIPKLIGSIVCIWVWGFLHVAQSVWVVGQIYYFSFFLGLIVRFCCSQAVFSLSPNLSLQTFNNRNNYTLVIHHNFFFLHQCGSCKKKISNIQFLYKINVTRFHLTPEKMELWILQMAKGNSCVMKQVISRLNL